MAYPIQRRLTTRVLANQVRLTVVIGGVTFVSNETLSRTLGIPQVTSALAVPLGILFGVPAVAGFVLGSLLYRLLVVEPEMIHAVHVVADVVLVAGGYLLWGRRRVPGIGDERRELLAGAARYLLVGGVALLLAVGVETVGAFPSDRAPFGVAAVLTLSNLAVPTLLLGLAVLLALGTVGNRKCEPLPNVTVTPGRLIGAYLALGLWLVTGSVLSAVRQDVTAGTNYSLEVVVRKSPSVLEPLVTHSLGTGYYVIQVSLAALAVSAVAWLVLGDLQPEY